MELWRYYRIIRRRRWMILACVVFCVGVVWIVNKYTPQKYSGVTKVMERRPGPEQGVPVYDTRYSGAIMDYSVHLSNLASICTSNTVVRRSLDTLADLGVVYGQEEQIQLLKNISVLPVPGTQILEIRYISDDPERAKMVSEVFAAEFRNFYNELLYGATTQSKEFIEKQLQDSKKRLIDAQNKIKSFKQNEQIVQLNQQSQLLLQRLSQAQAEAVAAGVSEQDASARLAVTESQEQSQDNMLLANEVVSDNPVWQQLVAQRAKLEAELASLEVHKGRKHPEVMAVTGQLEDIKKQIESTQQKIVSSQSKSLNQIKLNALDRYMNAQSERSAAAARRKAFEQAASELQEEMNKLPEQEMRLVELELELKTAQDTYALLLNKFEEAKIKEQESSKTDAIKVVEQSTVRPVDKKSGLKLILALILSPLLGIGLAFFLNYLDNTVRTPSEAEELLGLPVFTVVPLSRTHALVRRPDSPVLSAAYQMLDTKLWQTVRDTGKSTVVVASAEPDAGRSCTAANLAITLAADGARVILVDADMRKPSMHLMFGLSNKRGLSNLLSGTATIDETAVPTKFENLLLVPSGPIPDNPIRLLRQPQMQTFMDQIGSLADFVIFDTPAGITFADASLVAAYAHNVVIVHSAGRVPRGSESEFRSRLEHVGVNLIGVVLNRARPEDSHGSFHYRRSYQSLMPPKHTGKKAVSGSKTDMDV